MDTENKKKKKFSLSAQIMIGMGLGFGAAWTLLYPKFQVVVPVPDVAKTPLAYPVAGGDKEFAEFLSQWIMLKQDGLEYHRLYNHWILGQDAVPKQPRWSFIRDVLKWVN